MAGHQHAGVFTRGQRPVIELVAEGFSNAEIAAQLWLSRHTVHTHLKRACKRIGLAKLDRGSLINEAWWRGAIGDRDELLAEIARLRAENEKFRDELALTSSDHRIP